MTGPLDRAAAFFLAPAAAGRAPAATALPTHTRAVVLGTDEAAPSLAAALALTLRAGDRSASALVAVWHDSGPRDEACASAPGAGSSRRGAATPAACRLAARLRRRELPALARGRLVWLDLPPDPGAAAGAVRRAAAVVDGPVVTALAGARPRDLDRLVEEHDLIVVAADPEGPLARAALAGVPGGALAFACRPLRRGLPRAVALAGLAAPRLDPPLTASPRSEPA